MKKRVLVVDDDPDIRTLIRFALREEFELEMAHDGQVACEILASRPGEFQGMILDLSMPRKSGFEVLETIRSTPETQGLPVLVLTALADRQSRLDTYVGGAHVHLQKPFDPDALLRKLHELINRSTSGRNADRLGRLMDLTD